MITIDYLKTICETQWDWNRIFGALVDLYSDKGFKSKADNMLRAKILELSVVTFSELIHIDEDGVGRGEWGEAQFLHIKKKGRVTTPCLIITLFLSSLI